MVQGLAHFSLEDKIKKIMTPLSSQLWVALIPVDRVVETSLEGKGKKSVEKKKNQPSWPLDLRTLAYFSASGIRVGKIVLWPLCTPVSLKGPIGFFWHLPLIKHAQYTWKTTQTHDNTHKRCKRLKVGPGFVAELGDWGRGRPWGSPPTFRMRMGSVGKE